MRMLLSKRRTGHFPKWFKKGTTDINCIQREASSQCTTFCSHSHHRDIYHHLRNCYCHPKRGQKKMVKVFLLKMQLDKVGENPVHTQLQSKPQYDNMQTGGNYNFTGGQTFSGREFRSGLCLIYLALSWGGQINSTQSFPPSITRVHKKVVQVHYSRWLQGRSGNAYIWKGKAERINRIPEDLTQTAATAPDFKFCFVIIFQTEMLQCQI